jgi:HK97 family phage portal protein
VASHALVPTRRKAVFNLSTMQPILHLFGWRHVGGKLTGPDSAPAVRDARANLDMGPNAALQIATVWACIRLIAETISTLPLLVYRTQADGGRKVDKDHPLYELLHDSPHYDYTAVEFWEGIAASLCVAGNAYAEKLRVGGRLVALQPLPADAVEVFRTGSGARRYRYRKDGERAREIAEEDMFHVRGFGNGGDVGLSPISYARETLFTTRQANQAAAKLYGSRLRHEGILEMDQVMKDDQRKNAKENILDPILQGGSGILEGGMKFHGLTMSAKDAQMLETISFQIEEICRWFRVPPFMVGHTQKSTSWGTGLEQQNLGFLTYSLRPYLSRIEQSIRRSLMTPAERKTLTAEFKVEGLLRADTATRMTSYATGVQNGIFTRDEVRGWENLPPKGGAAAELTVQSQNVPIDQQPETTMTTPPADPDEDEE